MTSTMSPLSAMGLSPPSSDAEWSDDEISVPDIASCHGSDSGSAGTQYAERISLELSLLARYDTDAINPRTSCFYLIPTPWFDSWSAYIQGDRPPPGPIEMSRMYKGDSTTLREDMKPIWDYRGLNPTVYHIYKSLYSTDGCQPILRYGVDAGGPEAAGERLQEEIRAAKLKAEMEVRKLKLVLSERDLPGGMRKADGGFEEERVCGCLTHEAVDRIFFAVFSCCGNSRNAAYSKLNHSFQGEDAGETMDDRF